MRVMIAGGGTAGHINPGLAIAKHIKLKNPDAQILFIGTQRGMETKLIPIEGFQLKLIKVRGFKRKISIYNITAVKELLQGMIEARKIIKTFKPDIVIGTGGYVCGPVLLNASWMKIPTLIHEQNAMPGITNRILSRFVDVVAISFKDSYKYFKNAKKTVFTGNPIRLEMLMTDKISARQKLGVEVDKPLVVAVGGSSGAEKINNSVIEMLLKHYKKEDCNIIFATGSTHHEYTANCLKEMQLPSIRILPYIYDAGSVYNSADLVVCRAGAITISELTALGIPSIMIPSPNVTANHQEHNARALETQGAAVVMLEKDLNGHLLYRQITSLLRDKDQLSKMARNAKRVGITDASQKIYAIIQEMLDSRK